MQPARFFSKPFIPILTKYCECDRLSTQIFIEMNIYKAKYNIYTQYKNYSKTQIFSQVYVDSRWYDKFFGEFSAIRIKTSLVNSSLLGEDQPVYIVRFMLSFHIETVSTIWQLKIKSQKSIYNKKYHQNTKNFFLIDWFFALSILKTFLFFLTKYLTFPFWSIDRLFIPTLGAYRLIFSKMYSSSNSRLSPSKNFGSFFWMFS